MHIPSKSWLITGRIQMKKLFKNKSAVTSERMLTVIEEIKSYCNSIYLLDGYAAGRLRLKGKNYSEYAADYKRTTEDHERYLWTRKHIEIQISLLEKELEVLVKFGI